MAHPVLSRALAAELQGRPGLLAPTAEMLALPERAVQFGTGAFLRGFVDWFVDEANRQGAFGGRIVAIGSTGSGRDAAINEQDGLFTLVTRGVDRGEAVEERRIVGSVSRALSAADDWPAVLACARDPLLEVVFSNTTEVGIALDESDAYDASPPRSFPGKLTRFLHERAQAFGFAREKGVVVLPCELLEDNGDRLREIVLALAGRWALGDTFARWIAEAVPFCNTLVDRIVPGAPKGEDAARLREALGYDDAMLTTCEPYRLFAIEGPSLRSGQAPILEKLAAADSGIIVTGDIAPFRERKVRLLNGAHTLLAPLALLAGRETVREAVEDEAIGGFVRAAMLDEIVPSLDAEGGVAFAHAVLDRFANPSIDHALLGITLQATMKMRVRVVPSILAFARKTGRVPQAIALGFAAWLRFMRGDVDGERRRAQLPVPDDSQRDAVQAHWRAASTRDDAALARLAHAVCADRALWATDLSAVAGFADAVAAHLARIERSGIAAALDALPHARPAGAARA